MAEPRRPRQRILQVHPLLRCNLRCGHCYSDSSPAQRAELPLGALRQTIEEAAALGYETLALSGGEPFLWDGLVELAAAARSLGLRVTVTTNGTVVNDALVDRVAPVVDAVAVSIDGPEAVHNDLRAAPWAYERMLAGVEVLRRRGIPFGFIHTLTTRGVEHLPEVADVAAAEGGRLLQIHPLELTGRAAALVRGQRPAPTDLSRAFAVTLALRLAFEGTLTVQLDAHRVADLVADPWLAHADDADGAADPVVEADRLGTLVVEADGTIVPLAHSFGRRFAVGTIFDDGPSNGLYQGWARWVEDRHGAFTALARSALDRVADDPSTKVIAWLEHLTHTSRELIPTSR